jgi:hypothetical protein
MSLVISTLLIRKTFRAHDSGLLLLGIHGKDLVGRLIFPEHALNPQLMSEFQYQQFCLLGSEIVRLFDSID